MWYLNGYEKQSSDEYDIFINFQMFVCMFKLKCFWIKTFIIIINDEQSLAFVMQWTVSKKRLYFHQKKVG